MIDHKSGIYKCDYCGGRNGEFLTATGNHEYCQKKAETKKAVVAARKALHKAQGVFNAAGDPGDLRMAEKYVNSALEALDSVK